MKNNSKSKSNKISLSQLVLLGLGSLIGSGWLFGAWEASSMAGPAAIISWVIGFLVIGTIAYKDRKSTRLNSSHRIASRMPSSA